MKYLILLTLFISNTVIAQEYEGGSFVIESYRIDSQNTFIRLNPYPDECQGGTHFRMHAKISVDHVNYKALTSAVMAAYTAKSPIKYIWFQDNDLPCGDSNLLKINAIEFY